MSLKGAPEASISPFDCSRDFLELGSIKHIPERAGPIHLELIPGFTDEPRMKSHNPMKGQFLVMRGLVRSASA
jgi:hypothetical protein